MISKNTIKPSNKKYFYEISFIRAIACLCIVMVHVTAGFYYENGRTFTWPVQFFNQISRYGTPAFAIISGFLLYNQAINRKSSLKKFWQSRFTKVIIPFLVWSILYLFLKYMYNQFTIPNFNSSEKVKDFLYFFFTGKSNYHLYFIAVVVQFYLLFPLLRLIKTKNSLILLTVASFFINYFFVQYEINIGTGLLNKFINERVFIFHWIYYFFLGGLLVYFWEKIMIWIKQNTIFSMLIGLIVVVSGIFEYKCAGWIESNRVINMINLPLLFIALAGVYTSLSRWDKTRNFIVQIGNMSMGIYLVHPLILFFLRYYDFFDMFYARTRYFPLMYLFTLFTSIVIVKLITKLPFGSYIVTVAKANPSKNKSSRDLKNQA